MKTWETGTSLPNIKTLTWFKVTSPPSVSSNCCHIECGFVLLELWICCMKSKLSVKSLYHKQLPILRQVFRAIPLPSLLCPNVTLSVRIFQNSISICTLHSTLEGLYPPPLSLSLQYLLETQYQGQHLSSACSLFGCLTARTLATSGVQKEFKKIIDWTNEWWNAGPMLRGKTPSQKQKQNKTTKTSKSTSTVLEKRASHVCLKPLPFLSQPWSWWCSCHGNLCYDPEGGIREPGKEIRKFKS